MLCCVIWCLFSDVSKQHTGLIQYSKCRRIMAGYKIVEGGEPGNAVNGNVKAPVGEVFHLLIRWRQSVPLWVAR